MRIGKTIVILGAIILAAWYLPAIAQRENWQTYQWNQKLIVTVETPEGERAGAATVEVRAAFMVPCRYEGMSQMCVESSYRGEATIVHLPNGRDLFVLLKDNPGGMAQFAFHEAIAENVDDMTPSTAAPFYEFIEDYVGHPSPVPAAKFPRFVTFENLGDPASVKEVDPANLAASFGSGYALKSVMLEVTREPVSYGEVEALLPWLDAYYDLQFDGRRYWTLGVPNPVANSLSAGAFKVGN